VGEAVRLVWASLWSDAALLYRSELQLDPASSRMAVLVQEMAEFDRSGVAFGRDPRPGREHAIVEAVPGPCRLLVDGAVDPDHWEIDRGSRRTVHWRGGQREGQRDEEPLLDASDLDALVDTLFDVEALFKWAPDLEWTGRSETLTVLQARPITTAGGSTKDGRDWYLTLRPGDARLRELREKVVGELIPRLEAEGARLAAEDLARLDDENLADALRDRRGALEIWDKIYWDDFIPFAHGVRRLATYYNDALQPDDPYEFVQLLQEQDLLASRRNRSLEDLAAALAANGPLREAVGAAVADEPADLTGTTLRERVRPVTGGAEWSAAFERMSDEFLDIAYSGERLTDGVRSVLRNLLELSGESRPAAMRPAAPDVREMEERLLAAVGPERVNEAAEVIETARLSWRLRDDDNLLVGRIESQLLRAVREAEARLRGAGRLAGDRKHGPGAAAQLEGALRDPAVLLSLEDRDRPAEPQESGLERGERPRQLIGQPASPGLASGRVRCVRGPHDLGEFRAGEILVCDAIQPTITHLVPLASAIVERRGGMLIHGAIIARELGIPCVNGVADAVGQLEDGEVVTVDGHLGIVTVGPPEFDLELADVETA
jgi:pyruvate,water dikinase